MRGIPLFLIVGLTGLAAAGCGVNFYAGRPSDVRRIQELSGEIDRINRQKSAEAQQLKEAQALLEQRLKKEISDKQVKLEMAERGLVLTFVSEVLFDSGKAALRSEAKDALSRVASVIREKVSDRDIGVEGHTDNEQIKVSNWKSNWELSTARSTSVLHALEQYGVSPRRLVATGYGEYRPVASNDSSQGRQQNRRVEIVILPKKLTKVEQEVVRRAVSSPEPEVARKARDLEAYK
ncbi:MAG: flagellar motor protein MotB [Candidatus Omnitrophica bacterium]|nr:flagellar motor protein MotB [Candidatus Omnitrophota bacterium]